MAVQNRIHTLYTLPEPQVNRALEAELSALKDQLIGQIARASIADTVASAAMVTITCFFAVTPGVQLILVVWTIGLLVAKILTRAGTAYLEYQLRVLRDITTPEAIENKQNFEFFKKVLSFLGLFLSGSLYSTTLGTLVHESGHALAANLLFMNPSARIDITGIGEGVTHWWVSSLTSLGEVFGPKNARLLVSAAGSGLALLTSLGMIVAAHNLKEQHPEVSNHFYAMAFTTIVDHAGYALSALFFVFSGHDFATLAAGGIHPLFSLFVIIALPLLLLWALDKYDQQK